VIRLHDLERSTLDAALDQAVRFRELGEPSLAESVCLDVLDVVGEHQGALCLLIHAVCDQLLYDLGALSRARLALPRIEADSQRELLTGVVLERHARALLRRRPKGSREASWEGLMRAMEHYEAAAAQESDAALEANLRRNACARTLMAHGYLQSPLADNHVEHPIE
jgi:hypothetical protein